MRFDGMCKCIDENWNALKARIQASITGIKLNGTTYYQTDGTGICDLGTIETEPPTASDVKMADGTTVQDAITTNKTDIDTLNGEIDACLNSVGSVAVDNGLNINRTYIDGTESQAMFMTVDPDTITIDGKQIRVNDDVIADITTAKATATDAQTKANSAIVQLGTAVVDTALEMNVDKADESTATIPLFTAGTNLSWDGTTLNAEGGTPTYPYKYNRTADVYQNNTVLGKYSVYLNNIGLYRNGFSIITGTYGASVSEIATTTTALTSKNIGSVEFGIIGIHNETGYPRGDFVLGTFVNPKLSYNIITYDDLTFTVTIDDADPITITASLTVDLSTLRVQYTSLSVGSKQGRAFAWLIADGTVLYEGLTVKMPVYYRTVTDIYTAILPV